MKFSFKGPWWKKSLLILLAIAVIAGISHYYRKNIAVTKIAFVNYSSFHLARIEKSNDSKWIKIEDLKPEDIVKKIRHFDAIYVFGRGLKLSKEQSNALQQAGFAGKPIFCELANPDADVTNREGKDLDFITNYTRNGGNTNYRNLLHYSRAELDHKKWFVPAFTVPVEIAKDVFFHLEEEKTFTNVQEYENYLQKISVFKPHAPKIALLTSVPGPFNANRDHLDAIINAAQAHGWNIYPIASTMHRLSMLQQVQPDIVIEMPHGRIGVGNADSVVSWLRTQNIPLLSPLTVFDHYTDWAKSPQGMTGGLLTMNVALPEVDGAVAPYVIAAQFKDNADYDIFKVIPERLEKFCGLVEKWLTLRKKNNAQKRIAIYYFKGPGLNSLRASNMEVVPGLFNLLQQLKANGYNTGALPNNAAELEKIIQRSGAVLRPYAQGNMNRFFTEGNPAFVASSQYVDWAKKDLTSTQWAAVEAKYGAAPGAYMSLQGGGQSYIAVARIQLGNVVLLPQPLPGLGENTFALVHGAKMAPPHPYIASYLWTREAFHADAILHFGTHGSLEFTPGKQVALNQEDWSDALIGNTPHFYYYTISDVGEGIIAKRRSYATLISYLTPPMMKSGTTNEMAVLEEELHKWNSFAGPLRAEYGKTISKLAQKLGLYDHLGAPLNTALSEPQLQKLSNIVEQIDNEKVNAGLYTPGKPYTEAEALQTVRQICVDPVSYGLAKLAIARGQESTEIWKNSYSFNQKYRQRALTAIDACQHAGIASLQNLVSPEELAIADTWQKENQKPGTDAIVQGFIAMAAGGNSKAAGHHPHAKTGTKDENINNTISDLVVKILPYPQKAAFIDRLQSEKKFRDASALLDPQTLERANKIAVAIPKMKEGITLSQDPDVHVLLLQMQHPDIRKQVFILLKDKGLSGKVAAEKTKIEAGIRARAQSPSMRQSWAYLQPAKIASAHAAELKQALSALEFYQANAVILSQLPPAASLRKGIGMIHTRLANIAHHQAAIAEAVSEIKTAMENIGKYKAALLNSPQGEMNAMINALNGGYTQPSVGGDPIASPMAIPTGKNLYSIDAEKTPSPQASMVGNSLGQQLLDQYRQAHNGNYPQKVALTMWVGDFIQTEGSMLAEIFYLLGVEPVRDMMGKVVDVRLTPSAELKRPRIDVVVQTSGQFRDLAASRISLINKAVALAATDKEKSAFPNYVQNGNQQIEQQLKKEGIAAPQAKAFSTLRVFGGVNGNYGASIMEMVESGDKYENRDQVADTYLNNMGSAYNDDKQWDVFQKGLFSAALQNTDAVVQPRQSNTWGPLSLDHVYEFAGGINNAIRKVTGKEPDVFLSDTRNPSMAKMENVKDAILVESRSTLLNPNYIKEMMKGQSSSAETFAETFRNTFGWNVMKSDVIGQDLWNRLFDTYMKDSLHTGVQQFLRDKNPYALQEMTGVMMETARKKMWNATEEQLQTLAKIHSDLIAKNGAACSEFVCGNSKLQEEMAKHMNPNARLPYKQAIDNALKKGKTPPEIQLQKLNKENLKSSWNAAPKSNIYRQAALILILILMISGIVFGVIKYRNKKSK